MAAIREGLYDLIEQYRPMTIRQIFYQAVTRRLIDKTEGEYNHTIVRLLSEMRRSGELPFEWIADNTRWMRKPRTYSSLRGMLERTKETYRRALWDNQDAYVEVWLEKDALAGVLYQETKAWDVPLMVTRGYASLSYLYAAADTINDVGKPAYLYYFGDWDPSGRDIPRKVEEDLREFAPDAEIHFERVAVTEDQITAWNLPTRPTKTTDTRSKHFHGESVEVDAIAPEQLRSLVHNCIVQHLDRDQYNSLLETEDMERATLERILLRLPGAGRRAKA